MNQMLSCGVSSLYVRPAVLVCYDVHIFEHEARRSRSRKGDTHTAKPAKGITRLKTNINFNNIISTIKNTRVPTIAETTAMINISTTKTTKK